MASSEGLTTWLFEPESFSPLAREDTTGSYAVVTDHLGAPTEMYDELGQLAWRMQLDSFGVGRVDVALQHCPDFPNLDTLRINMSLTEENVQVLNLVQAMIGAIRPTSAESLWN